MYIWPSLEIFTDLKEDVNHSPGFGMYRLCEEGESVRHSICMERKNKKKGIWIALCSWERRALSCVIVPLTS